MSKKFVKREQEIIERRGYDLDKYSFGKDMPYEELFKIFYDNMDLGPNYPYDNNLSNLTMSELVEYYACFIIYRDRFVKRQRYFDKELKAYKKAQMKTLKSDFSSDLKEKEMSKLEDLSKKLSSCKDQEEKLINYNELSRLIMLNELKQITGYIDNSGTNLIIFKEILLLNQLSYIRNIEKNQYNDINFDAYSHYTAPIRKNLSYLNK